MSDSGLSPPGGAIYAGKTMTVGDGTWDSSMNDFLLPNIQGLNYETMRYNGMGNRFSSMAEYHSLIRAHGVIAAITFLGVVPTAILTARFYYRDPRFALKTHISLQVMTLILSTVVLILGYFAVGPARSLTNPHHGIGVAIYVLVVIQTLGGAIIHRIEKGKVRYYLPIKLMLHQWLGRAIALLALAQIPIGLTLYGSPLYLFILYAVTMAILAAIYFILTYLGQRRLGLSGYDDRASYVSGTQTDLSRQDGRSRVGALTGALAGGIGLEALRRRFSNRSRRRDGRSDAGYSQGPQGPNQSQFGPASYVSEKYSQGGRSHTWGDRILGGAAGLGAAATVRHFWNRARGRDDADYDDRYQQPTHGPPIAGSIQRLDQMEEGRPLVPPGVHGNRPVGAMRSGQHQPEEDWQRVERLEAEQAAAAAGTQYPPAQGQQAQAQSQYRPYQPARRQGDSVVSYDSRTRRSDTSYDRPGLLGKLATVGGVGEYLRWRRSRKEQRRVDAERQRERENERVFGRPADQPLVVADDGPRPHTGMPASHVSFRDPPTEAQTQTRTHDFATSAGAPPPSLIPGHAQSQPPQPPNHNDLSTNRLNVPSAFQDPVRPYNSQGQSPYASRTNLPQTSSPLRNTSQAQNPLPPPPPVSSSFRGTPPHAQPGSTGALSPAPFTSASPPVAVKVRVHDDHVTLRRLNEEEAAAERERRHQAREQFQQQQQQQQQQQPGPRLGGRPSVSDVSAGPSGYYRRQQPPGPGGSMAPMAPDAPQNQRPTIVAVPGDAIHQPAQPPPATAAPYPRQSLYDTQPITPARPGLAPGGAPAGPTPPGMGYGMGSSPGTYDTTTGTDVSNYDSNRRRRRAERARAEQARLAARMGGFGSGGSVSAVSGGPAPAPGEGGGFGGQQGGGGRRVGFA